MERRPDLFIIGAPKSGTTSLYRYLREHPEVYMSAHKEPMYFSPDFENTWRTRYHYGRDEARYLALFAGAGNAKRVGEASTHYMASAAAPLNIHAFAPQARIVCMLRNPVEVAYAWHAERVYRGVEDDPVFDERLLDSPNGRPYLEIGRYGTQLRRWFDVFGRSQVHVIVFDDFVADTADQYRRLLVFLDVDPDLQPAAFVAHNAVHSKSRLVPLLRSRPAQRIGTAIESLAGRAAARRLSRAVRRLPVRMRARSGELRPEVRARLEAAYRAEVEVAGELIGRDLAQLWLPAAGENRLRAIS